MDETPKPPRMTKTTLAVLEVFLTDPTKQHYGLAISRASDVTTGSLYYILSRLERRGWLTSTWQEATIPGRPSRRYYQMTDEGLAAAKAAAKPPAPQHHQRRHDRKK